MSAEGFLYHSDETSPVGGVPTGGIIMWSGATNNIPSGWALCDGNNSTPNLQDRFIVGAGNSYAVNATGGSASGTTSTDSQAANGSSYDGANIGNLNRHTHDYDNLPPYYALAYIIKT